MTDTDKNLGEAFAGESQANRRYIFFAAKADTEGYPQVARLFRAAAEAETVHARNHFNAMDGVGSTKANLNAGIIGEHQEFTGMYPKFIEQSRIDKYQRAEISFDWANKVEEIHHGFFQAALKALESGETMKLQFGHTYEKIHFSQYFRNPDFPKNRRRQLLNRKRVIFT